jgi:hypothetical protein
MRGRVHLYTRSRSARMTYCLKLLGKKFQNFGRLTINLSAGPSIGMLILGLRLNRAGNCLIEHNSNRLVSAEDAFGHEGAKERN